MWIVAGVAALGVATALVLNAFQSNMVFYLTPTQVATNEAPRDRAFRVGGLVEEGSLVREKDALTVRFKVTDTARTIPVVYTGILPDLFKEGKGVIAQGRVGADGIFRATVDFRVPLLTPVAFDFGDGQALYPDGGERFAHLVELERLDDCHHDFHKVSPFADCGSPALHVTFRRPRGPGSAKRKSSSVPVARRAC